ncbi:MAG: EF-P lysine aminoacylase GenX [Chitinispirillaceae bacterium]|nr:EF-P lysine aminoacylase GenX [Chitinispirillaceae bacterium]
MNFETAKKRSEIIGKIREFFRARNVLEVETPVLSHGSPADCHIDVFSAGRHPAEAQKPGRSGAVYLRTSPEFHMKRLLASGYRDIFQIGNVFRNGERGRLHNPEFTMLEWYRIGMDMACLMDETAAFITAVLGKRRIMKYKYAEVFKETTGIDPLAAGVKDVAGYCESRGKVLFSGATLTDALQFVMAEFIEPALPADACVFVHHYPADQAVLAVLEPDDTRVARRFEAYCGGLELVNGFEELADWKENERRQQEENKKRKSAGKPGIPLDRQFIDALKKGMPSCSGAALGLDRLVMLALGKQSIDDVLTFPWEKS